MGSESPGHNRLWVTVVICVAFSTAVTLVVNLTRESSPAGRPPDSGAEPFDARRIAELEARVAALERGTMLASTSAETGDQIPGERRRLGGSGEGLSAASLDARIAVLEQAVGGQTPSAVVSNADPLTPEEKARLELIIREAERVITDPGASAADKVAAHERLRYVPEALDAYSEAMTDELVRIGQSDSSAAVRADVWRLFHGPSTGVLRSRILQPLMRAASVDTDANVRAEAYETLGNYLEDPSVLAALQWAAKNDPDKLVRFKARRSLGLGPETDGRND